MVINAMGFHVTVRDFAINFSVAFEI